MIPLRALAPFARRALAPPRGERCELCGADLDGDHPHVVELGRRTPCCACRACAILFAQPGPAAGRYRTVPDRVLVDPEWELSQDEWAALEVPVLLAFLFFDSTSDRLTALYPSPAGVTESAVSPEAWSRFAAQSRLAACMQPDVEALLVYGRRGAARLECFLVPIDACYELAARIRQRWRGFDGGDEARGEVEAFFDRLRGRGRPLAAPRPPGGVA